MSLFCNIYDLEYYSVKKEMRYIMKNLTKYFNPISTITFAICIILAIYGTITYKTGLLPVPWLIIPICTGLCFFIASKLNKLENLNMTVDEYRRIAVIMCILLFTAQIITAIFADFTPINDLSYVCTGAKNLILNKNIYDDIPEVHNDYFEVYPNNHFLFTVIYLLYKIEFMLTGNITDTLPTALNLIGLNISYILMCRIAEIIHKPSKAFLCAVRGMLFTPLITYTSFFYTDSMTMPLVTSAAYFYLKFKKSGKITQLIICGTLIGMAYKMKGSSLILLIAVIIDMIMDKFKIKNFAVIILPCIIICKIISETALKILHISHETLKQKSFPLIHWIMMSADGRGGYNSADFLYTQSFTGDNKKSAALARLAEKMHNQGFFGFLHHIAEKISYTWENFTFMAGYYYNDSFSSRIFIVVSFLCHFTLLFSILISMKKSTDKTFLFRLCLFGLIIFLLIWETRCRYLVSFFPLFLLI